MDNIRTYRSVSQSNKGKRNERPLVHLRHEDGVHGLLRQDAEQVDAEYGGGLGEEHELGELPADDEQRGGGRHCNNTTPSQSPLRRWLAK